jgi:thiol:disulfide interchange protein DsbC
VKVLLFPLPMHQGAKEQCVAVFCDKKGFDDLENGYKSDNQCAEGVKRVDETIAFLQSKGIGSTPSYILPDGRSQAGVLEEEALRQRLGLPAGAPKSPEAKPAETKGTAPKAPESKPAAPKK